MIVPDDKKIVNSVQDKPGAAESVLVRQSITMIDMQQGVMDTKTMVTVHHFVYFEK